MRQAYDGFRAMGVDPLFDADLVSAVCFNHTDPFWGDLDGILFSRFSKGKGFRLQHHSFGFAGLSKNWQKRHKAKGQ